MKDLPATPKVPEAPAPTTNEQDAAPVEPGRKDAPMGEPVFVDEDDEGNISI